MNRRTVYAGCLLIAAAAPAADPDARSPKDLFGRPRPHGEPVKGAFVGLAAGRTNLFFGQPLEIDLFAVPVSEQGPYLAVTVGEGANARLELTDGAGRPVPFRLDPTGGGSGLGLSTQVVQLWPTPAHAVGVYWKPGTYRLRATVEQAGDAARPNFLPGTFRTNVLTLTVALPGAPLDRCEPDGTTRDRVGKLLAALDAPAVADRDAAEKALASETDLAVLLLLDSARATASAEAGPRLNAAIKVHDERLVRASGRPGGYYQTAYWHWVGGLDPVVSDRLRRRAGFDEATWRTNAARYAPVAVPQDRPLTAVEAAQLITDLRHADPWVRMLTVRSVPKGSPVEVRAALAERIGDPYREWSRGVGDPAQFPPILFATRDAAGRLGTEMVEPLVKFAGRDENRDYCRPVADTLAKIGPDPIARDFLRGLIQGGRSEDQYGALTAATAWGKGGVELLREMVAKPGVARTTFRDAIEGLGKSGDPDVDGPVVHKQLTDPASGGPDFGVRMAAARAVADLRYKPGLADLERIARNPKENQNTRYVAVDGVLAMVDAKAGDQLLLDLTDPEIGGRVRGFAFTRIGRRKVTAALPILLKALADEDWYTRVMADGALRALAGRWEGVGYDARSPAPSKWRDYWAAKPSGP